MVGTDRQLRPAAVASRKLRPHNLPERVLVIDEDPLAREKVLRMLRQQDSAFTATAGWEGLHGVLPLVRLHCPAVLILNLPDSPLRAAALLDELRTTCEVKILCVTTYSPMVLEQLAENGFPVVFKPFDAERFWKAFAPLFPSGELQ